MIDPQHLRSLIREPTALRFRELETILYQFGYALVNSKGSHFRFKKKNFPSLTIPVHNKMVKKWYIKDICKILLTQLP